MYRTVWLAIKAIAPLYLPNRLTYKIGTLLDKLLPLGDLVLRCWIAHVFWVSDLLKWQNWDSTLYLFEYEYAMPPLPADIAARCHN